MPLRACKFDVSEMWVTRAVASKRRAVTAGKR